MKYKTDNINKIVLQNILHNINIGIHVIDKEGKTIFYNDTMARLEGIDRDEIMEKNISDIFPNLNKDTSTLLSVLRSGNPILEKKQTYLNYKGEKIITINTTIPLYDNGIIVGALEIAKDITYLSSLSEKLIELEDHKNLDKSKLRNSPPTNNTYHFSDIIGRDEKMLKAINLAKRTSSSPSSVMIYGETGTGKELFAQSIHNYSERRSKPFISQNCAAIPDTLLESLLFGTVKGAFTDAVDRKGIFEQADGGTLLLDEINSMSLHLQAKLLRVLQESHIRRLGGTKDIRIDVKIIATTNENPMESIKNGNLRKDLFYRLSVINIHVPPLKDRLMDIPILCNHFINKYNIKTNKNIMGLEEDITNIFYKHDWPGNVRELENIIEAAINYAKDNTVILKKEDFKNSFHFFNMMSDDIEEDSRGSLALPLYLETIENKIISETLDKYNNNITKAAKALGIKRQTLQHKIKKAKAK